MVEQEPVPESNPQLITDPEEIQDFLKTLDSDEEVTRGQALVLLQKIVNGMISDRDEHLEDARVCQRGIAGAQQMWAQVSQAEATGEFRVHYYKSTRNYIDEDGDHSQRVVVKWKMDNKKPAGFETKEGE